MPGRRRPPASSCRAGAADCLATLGTLDAEVKAAVASIPARTSSTIILTSHDAFGYFEHEHGLTFHAPKAFRPGADPRRLRMSPKLIQQIRRRNRRRRLSLLKTSTDPTPDPSRSPGETELKVGGELYSDALSDADGPAAAYVDLMRHNIATIKGAIGGS